MSKVKSQVSVIVPTHNDEKYVERCIKSIVNQSYQNLQIIIVDDGSTDCTLNIAKKFLDDRVIVESIENIGVSGARNHGLKIVSGEYILFVDADDWLVPGAIEMLMEIVSNKNYELIIGNYSREKDYSEDNKIGECSHSQISVSEAYQKIINPFGFYGSVWAKLFVTDIILENNISFNEEISVGEDLLFVYQYLKIISKIGYVDSAIYNYFMNTESVLNILNKHTYKKRMDILKVYNLILLDCNNKDDYYERTVSIYTRELVYWYCYTVHYKDRHISEKLKADINKYLLVFLKDSTFSFKTKFVTLCKCYFPRIMYYVVHYLYNA